MIYLHAKREGRHDPTHVSPRWSPGMASAEINCRIGLHPENTQVSSKNARVRSKEAQ